MLATLMIVVLVLIVLAVLPFVQTATLIVDDDDADEQPALRYKHTRQR